MSYRVTLSGPNPLESSHIRKDYIIRAQAIQKMRLYAFAKLKDFALLDTQSAHDVMKQINACDDILPPQDCRVVEISNTGYRLTLSNTARSPR